MIIVRSLTYVIIMRAVGDVYMEVVSEVIFHQPSEWSYEYNE